MVMTLHDQVYCDYYGEAHDRDDPDPMREGPVDPRFHGQQFAYWESPWTYGFVTEYQQKLLYFTCPGPHYKLWKGAEI